MYELPNESPNDLRLRILGNFNKIPEKLGIDSKSPASHPKNQISTVVVEKCEKICCTKETLILLNFVNVYKIFFAHDCLRNHFVSSNWAQTPRNLNFL